MSDNDFTVLTVTQGDKLEFTLELTDENGDAYSLSSSDTIWLNVSTFADNTLIDDMCVTQTSTSFSFDSVDLDEGRYYMDMGVAFSDGTNYTFLPTSKAVLVVEKKVGGLS